MIPLLASGLESNKIGVKFITIEKSANEMTKEFEQDVGSFQLVLGPGETAPDKPSVWASVNQAGEFDGTGAFGNYKASWGTAMDYVEVQIWGELTLDDVRAFEFTQSPPSDKFLVTLKQRCIQIRNASQPTSQKVWWQPPEDCRIQDR